MFVAVVVALWGTSCLSPVCVLPVLCHLFWTLTPFLTRGVSAGDLKRLAKAELAGANGTLRDALHGMPGQGGLSGPAGSSSSWGKCRAWLGVDGFPRLLAKPGSLIDLPVDGQGADLFCAGTARRSGIRPWMATIIERALT